MLPGSVYYHFASKDELLVAIYKIGVEELAKAAKEALSDVRDPMDRLRAVCRVHLEAILGGSDFAAVVVRVLPRSSTTLHDRLVTLRDGYESIFRELIDALPLAPGINRTFLRLSLLGALNSALVWYHAGPDDPATIAERIIRRFTEGETRAA
jgi:AcrR family transcriptional regulator